jgi:hypothetical protein
MDRALRPKVVCLQLLRAMEASEGRRKRRKRDTTPDAIGLEVKRGLLEEIVAGDPEPGEFEAGLLERCQTGAQVAMARSILEEWNLARNSPSFRAWLASGARSDDL